jgi:hypothetical protein
MRPALNCAASWLREHKDTVTDDMIKSICVDGEIKITLLFATEDSVAAFGNRHLAFSSVDKSSNTITGNICYTARFIWRKRVFAVIMLVQPSLGQPAREVFSGEPRR